MDVFEKKFTSHGVNVTSEEEERVENIGWKLDRQAAAKTSSDLAGPGFGLAQGFIDECAKVVATGANPELISKGIEKTEKALVHELNLMSKGSNDPEAEAGGMIAEAMSKVGKNEGKSAENKGAVEEGIVGGGGCTFLGLADKVDSIKDTLENEEEKVGADIVKKALSNAGEGGNVVNEKFVRGSLEHAATTARWFLMPHTKGPGASKPVDTSGWKLG